LVIHGNIKKSNKFRTQTGNIFIFLGSKLGAGVYFATHAGYSVCYYASSSKDSKCYIYRCKVLTGRYTLGKPHLKEPPPIDENNPLVKYDSVVENETNPNEFALFTDNRKYPEYLIIFKKDC
jgi:hypothetical protein